MTHKSLVPLDLFFRCHTETGFAHGNFTVTGFGVILPCVPTWTCIMRRLLAFFSAVGVGLLHRAVPIGLFLSLSQGKLP